MRECMVCGQPVIGNNNSSYCRVHSNLANKARFIRDELENAYQYQNNHQQEGTEKQTKTGELLDLWMSLSPETQFDLSLRMASFALVYRGRGIGPLGMLELTVKTFKMTTMEGG